MSSSTTAATPQKAQTQPTFAEILTRTTPKKKRGQSASSSSQPAPKPLADYQWSVLRWSSQLIAKVAMKATDFAKWLEEMDEEYQDAEKINPKANPQGLAPAKLKKYQKYITNYLNTLGIDKKCQTAILIAFVAGFVIAALGAAFAIKAAFVIGAIIFLGSSVAGGFKYNSQRENLAASVEAEKLHKLVSISAMTH